MKTLWPGWASSRRAKPMSTPGSTGVEGGGGAWPGLEVTRRATRQHAKPHWCGGHRRARRAWLRCPWAVAGPGRASSRRAEPKARGADGSRAGRRPRAHRAARPSRACQAARPDKAHAAPGTPVGQHNNTGIQAERPASSVARWTPPRPASWAAWVRHEKPSARYTASGCAARDGSSECDATATDRS